MNMTHKESFVKAFEEHTGLSPVFFKEHAMQERFNDILSRNPSLKYLFRLAVDEAKEEIDDESEGETVKGLEFLFS